MEIEELFCKRYPEYSVNGKPLHPYFDVFEEGYEQAEKENAELKEELKDANEKVVHLACNQNKDLKHKLTKATEIIREIMKYDIPTLDYEKAEQFLKEIEK